MSNASPVQEQKAVGIDSTEPFLPLKMKAGEVASHTVYPRASHVLLKSFGQQRIYNKRDQTHLRPPLGKEEASGSPLINARSENSSVNLSSPGSMSCANQMKQQHS